MAFQFSCDVDVRWKDVDAGGVLNNAVYLTFLEQARFEYFRDLDLLVGPHEFPFLLGETCIRFLSPGRAGMTLTVFTRVQQLGDKSLEMVYEVCNGADVLANAVATLVWVDADLSSTSIPLEARERISRFEEIPLYRDPSPGKVTQS